MCMDAHALSYVHVLMLHAITIETLIGVDICDCQLTPHADLFFAPWPTNWQPSFLHPAQI